MSWLFCTLSKAYITYAGTPSNLRQGTFEVESTLGHTVWPGQQDYTFVQLYGVKEVSTSYQYQCTTTTEYK